MWGQLSEGWLLSSLQFLKGLHCTPGNCRLLSLGPDLPGRALILLSLNFSSECVSTGNLECLILSAKNGHVLDRTTGCFFLGGGELLFKVGTGAFWDLILMSSGFRHSVCCGGSQTWTGSLYWETSWKVCYGRARWLRPASSKQPLGKAAW